jgi:tetratricopeptide (TPR) repeat protein
MALCLPSLGAPTADHRADELIAKLSSDDAAVRRSASDKLVALGLAGRPDVLAATHSDDPETRSEAAAILLRLPWAQPGDPLDVRLIIDRYANFTDPGQPPFPAPGASDERKAAVQALAQLPDHHGYNALIRLVYEDPDDDVRWAAVHELRTNDDEYSSHLVKVRGMTPSPDDPAQIALCGIAWMAADPQQAAPLMQQALDAAYQQAGEDNPELDFLVTCLVDSHLDAKEYGPAMDLLRRQLAHGAPVDQQNTPLPLLQLFVLHANFGPLPGFDDDMRKAANFLDSPKIEYAIARIDQQNHQPEDAAQARQAAFAAGNDSKALRFDVGRFLADNGWNTEAEAEFKAYLSMPPGDEADNPDASDSGAHFELAGLALTKDDDAAVARELKMAMSMTPGEVLECSDSTGRKWEIPASQEWADIEWHSLRAAQKEHDDAGVSQHLAALLKLNPTGEDIAIDAVPLLKQRGQAADARRLFTAAYQAQRPKLDADPTNPALMNDVAWLDSKCDENLDEALKLATSATSARPKDAAIMDTLAEVNFHLGRYSTAVELETKALTLQPNDPFMEGQLARFKAAAKSGQAGTK